MWLSSMDDTCPINQLLSVENSPIKNNKISIEGQISIKRVNLRMKNVVGKIILKDKEGYSNNYPFQSEFIIPRKKKTEISLY